MPALVGVIQIVSIANAGIFNVGDVYKMTPISTSKAFAGAGSFNTGEKVTIDNNYSTTNTYDQDGFDQPIAFTF